MKRMTFAAVMAVLILFLFPLVGFAEPLLIPVGKTVGLRLQDNTVTIADFDDTLGESARHAGLKIGDVIVKVNGSSVQSIEDVREALGKSAEKTALTIRRGSRNIDLQMTPRTTKTGIKLGLYLKQGITGIGTVTWFDPSTGKFGALGHGVNDSSGVLMHMAEGSTFPAAVESVTKGKNGHPGQLKGTCGTTISCGELLRNTPQGIFGKSRQGWRGEPIPVASPSQIHIGTASIRSTVQGNTTNDYSVEILKVYSPDRTDGKNLLIRVTDPALLEATGGIVQGMSGSPIIQDGRLIGAVTHVLVNDPTVGYGIFLEKMLDAAG